MTREHAIFTCMQEINKHQESILKASSHKKYEIMKDLYGIVKELSPVFIKTREDAEKFRSMSRQIALISNNLLPNESIITLKPYNFSKKQVATPDMDAEVFLNYLVYRARTMLREDTSINSNMPYEAWDLTNYCQSASFCVYDHAQAFGLDAKVKIIEPGYLLDGHLYNWCCSHCFVIIQTNDKYYLIDPTYSQFFLLKRCLLECIGIVGVASASPGAYMVMNERRKKTAEKILNDGWIELTPEVFKDYLDGFTIFYRNGLYYEKTGDFSFTTPYTAEDYHNFLTFEDDQVAHEAEEVLGFQYRTLKNPYMKFR